MAVRDKKEKKNKMWLVKLVKLVRKQGGDTYLSSQDHIGFSPDLLLHSEIDGQHMAHIEKRHVIYQYVERQKNCLLLLLLLYQRI